MRLIFKTSSVTLEFFYVFNLILSFSTCSQSFKKICVWELLGANVVKFSKQRYWFKKKSTSMMFPTRSWSCVFYLWSQASFTCSQSSSTSLFCQANIRESRGLSYVCMGVIFSNPKINSMHISYMFERCKMFVLFDLYWNRSLNVILKKFENAMLSFKWNLNKIRWCK